MTKFVPGLWWVSFLINKFCLLAMHRVRLEGALDRRDGPAILAAKHASYWDIPLVAMVARRVFRAYPRFEMGSFAGYSFLGKVSWYLELLGAFPVMRTKDALRMKRLAGGDRAVLAKRMAEVNDRAVRTRALIFQEGHALCYFPEGTRTKSAVTSFRSRHEIEEAGVAAAQGTSVTLMAVVPCYGKKPRFTVPFLRRREVVVRVLGPVDHVGRDVRDVLAEMQGAVEACWHGG